MLASSKCCDPSSTWPVSSIGRPRQLHRLGLPAIDWNDPGAVRSLVLLLDGAEADLAHEAAREPLLELHGRLDKMRQWGDAAAVVGDLTDAVANLDHDAFAAGIARLERLEHVMTRLDRREDLLRRLRAGTPWLAAALTESPGDEAWSDRLGQLSRSWEWLAVGQWIRAQEATDVSLVQQQVQSAEDRLRAKIEELAAIRAWGRAAAPDRIGPEEQAQLQQYALLVRKLGKGTGKRAAAKKADIRRTLDRCRASVPAWIMPLGRVVQQLDIQPNLFDVVIVDEASQAGLEATFLQYLAPKMVVIGDDLQVSPSAVGVDRDELRALANQYLRDDPFVASWQNPEVSLFDQAKMRFGAPITLTEHRRCVPEVIGFSNRIAYTPNNITLQPVRMFGADRLDPVVPVYVRDGVRTGGGQRAVNRARDPRHRRPDREVLHRPSIRRDDLRRHLTPWKGTSEADRGRAARALGPGGVGGARSAMRRRRGLPGSRAQRDHAVDGGSDGTGRASAHRAHGQHVHAAIQRRRLEGERPDVGVPLGRAARAVQPRRHAIPADRLRVWHKGQGARDRRPSSHPPGVGGHPAGALRLLVRADASATDWWRLATRSSLSSRRSGTRSTLSWLAATRGLQSSATATTGTAPSGTGPISARQRDLERCDWTFHRIRESAFYLDPGAEIARLRQALFDAGVRLAGEEPIEPAPVSSPPSVEAPEVDPTVMGRDASPEDGASADRWPDRADSVEAPEVIELEDEPPASRSGVAPPTATPPPVSLEPAPGTTARAVPPSSV